MKHIRTICLWLGCGLIICALALFLWQQEDVKSARMENQKAVEVISAVLGEPVDALPDERSDLSMPVYPVDGVDYVGLLSLPERDALLAVRNRQDRYVTLTCRYEGSVYDGSLVILTSSETGQVPFYQQLEIGETVCFIDVTGKRFSYAIADIQKQKEPDPKAVSREGQELVILIQNRNASEYLCLSCNGLNG